MTADILQFTGEREIPDNLRRIARNRTAPVCDEVLNGMTIGDAIEIAYLMGICDAADVLKKTKDEDG